MNPYMEKNIEKKLQDKSRLIRLDVIRSLTAAGSGHLGGSLGLADVMTCLYSCFLRHDPENPRWENRDRLILSIGHVAPVLYSTLASAGYFDPAELLTLRKLGSRLQGHPGREHGLPGLELSAGSLGQGLSVAVGISLAAKMQGKDFRVVSVHGDGELQEGSIWEAAMSAAHHKLSNLIAIVDRNKVQIDGHTRDVMEIEPLKQKWEAFGWHVLECDGNSIPDILKAFDMIKRKSNDEPTVLIAHTIMGKGVPEIEGDFTWHGKAPDEEQAERFEKQLLNNY